MDIFEREVRSDQNVVGLSKAQHGAIIANSSDNL
jgi:hypothetical protein